jgi:hypothetical protein
MNKKKARKNHGIIVIILLLILIVLFILGRFIKQSRIKLIIFYENTEMPK